MNSHDPIVADLAAWARCDVKGKPTELNLVARAAIVRERIRTELGRERNPLEGLDIVGTTADGFDRHSVDELEELEELELNGRTELRYELARVEGRLEGLGDVLIQRIAALEERTASSNLLEALHRRHVELVEELQAHERRVDDIAAGDGASIIVERVRILERELGELREHSVRSLPMDLEARGSIRDELRVAELECRVDELEAKLAHGRADRAELRDELEELEGTARAYVNRLLKRTVWLRGRLEELGADPLVGPESLEELESQNGTGPTIVGAAATPEVTS